VTQVPITLGVLTIDEIEVQARRDALKRIPDEWTNWNSRTLVSRALFTPGAGLLEGIG
jgi:hypothetical protein